MEHITIANIDKDMAELIAKGGMTPGNLERLTLMGNTRKAVMRMPCNFGEEEAREWVAQMSPAARWTMEQTTAVMQARGYNHRPCEFWAVMNMLASDYGKVMAKYNADKPEVWADMADAWITDPDARPHKTGLYWRGVVEK